MFDNYANGDFYKDSIFNILINSLNLKANQNNPEEVLLSPQNNIIEKRFVPFSKLIDKDNYDYLNKKSDLNELGITYDIVMLIFILLLELRNQISLKLRDENGYPLEHSSQTEKRQDINYIEILDVLKDKIIKVLKEHDSIASDGERAIDLEQIIVGFSNKLAESLIKTKIFDDYIVYDKTKNILKFLISAHSLQRCLSYNHKGLFNYLRGCEYGGAPHLQSKASMLLIADHIVYNYCLPDNIRYLDLRCAVDG